MRDKIKSVVRWIDNADSFISAVIKGLFTLTITCGFALIIFGMVMIFMKFILPIIISWWCIKWILALLISICILWYVGKTI